MNAPYELEMHTAIRAARAAGEAIRDLYDRSAARLYTKGDGSPVTDADLAADRIIRDVIGSAFPEDAFLTEEVVDDPARLSASRVWVVDPIDGTAQFVARTGEFDVLIALVIANRPVVGVMLQPTTGRLLAAASGLGAFHAAGERLEPLRLTPPAQLSSLRLATSTWLGAPETLQALTAAMASLGAPPPIVTDLGIYARHLAPPHVRYDALIGLPQTADQNMAWEWDFAAADVVITEAGGQFTNCWGELHRYNKPFPRNEDGMLMSTSPELQSAILSAIGPYLPSR